MNVTNLLLARGVAAARRVRAARRARRRARPADPATAHREPAARRARRRGSASPSRVARRARAGGAQSAGLPRAGAIGVDGAGVRLRLGVTTLIGLAFGSIPALQAARSDPRTAAPARLAPHRRRAPRTRSALVVAEVALALVLLVSSGLLLRSMRASLRRARGLRCRRVCSRCRCRSSGTASTTQPPTYRFFDAALEAVRRVPGVIAAGVHQPAAAERRSGRVRRAASRRRPTLPADDHGVFRYAVSPGYFEAMGIPLRRGRLLDERDDAGAPLVVLISESLANSRFRGQDPIGQRLRIGPAGPFTIVGVVGDVKQMSLALVDSDAVYLNVSQGFATAP